MRISSGHERHPARCLTVWLERACGVCHRERFCLAGLISVLILLAFPMIKAGMWHGATPGVFRLEGSSVPDYGLGIVGMYLFGMILSLNALVSREVSLSKSMVGVLLAAPVLPAYIFVVDLWGKSAILAQAIEVAPLLVSVLASLVLVLPWFWWKLVWPRRSAGHLAVSAGILILGALQFFYHIEMVIPGAEVSARLAAQVRTVIEKTTSPDELSRLVDIGVLPLQRVSESDLGHVLAGFDTQSPKTVEASARKIASAHPHAVYAWSVDGATSTDRVVLVYDGRSKSAQFWIAGPDAFGFPRRAAIASYVFLTGVGYLGWYVMILLVVFFHGGSRKRSAGWHARR